MAGSASHRSAERAADRARSRAAEDLERLCADAGISLRMLERASGVPHGYISEIIDGRAKPSLETYARLAIPLGADLVTRLYSNTGPTIRDRHQARILEHLLEVRLPRYRPWTEVGVTRPAHGWIDVVFEDEDAAHLIATEIASDVRRIEQTVRWSKEKAASLPSWQRWPAIAAGGAPTVSQLLVVRRTRSNRRLAEDFARQLAVAYPAHPEDAISALTGAAPWPGNAL